MSSGGPGRPPRPVVTGIGVLSVAGIGQEAFWDGVCRARPITTGHIEHFEPTDYMTIKEARRLDRFTQIAVAAGDEAMEDAKIADGVGDPDRQGVVMGIAMGGMHTVEQQIRVYDSKGPRRVTPFLAPSVMPNAAAAGMSIRLGWRGPVQTVATACAAGADAVTLGCRLIAAGECDRVLVGGAESIITPVTVAGFTNAGVCSATGRLRAFDARRDGTVLSEGAAVLVLESEAAALARGARIYAEVVGAAQTADAYHLTAPAPDGEGAARCMRLALQRSGVPLGGVGFVNAHGTGTRLNDTAELQAVVEVFGGNAPPVTSTKGATGHAIAGAGALASVVSVLALERRLIPPTSCSLERDEGCSVDVVSGAPRPFSEATVLQNAFAFGGNNSCLVFARHDNETGGQDG